jgi:hypothetical protein
MNLTMAHVLFPPLDPDDAAVFAYTPTVATTGVPWGARRRTPRTPITAQMSPVGVWDVIILRCQNWMPRRTRLVAAETIDHDRAGGLLAVHACDFHACIRKRMTTKKVIQYAFQQFIKLKCAANTLF